MNTHKFNGRWEGVFKYGKGYPNDARRTKQDFALELTFNGESFQGICEDYYTRKFFEEPAIVTGEFKGGYLRFTKQYPALLIANEEMQTIVVPDQPSLDIIYYGYYGKNLFSRIHAFRGEWSIIQTFVDDNGPFDHKVRGSWFMKKVK